MPEPIAATAALIRPRRFSKKTETQHTDGDDDVIFVSERRVPKTPTGIAGAPEKPVAARGRKRKGSEALAANWDEPESSPPKKAQKKSAKGSPLGEARMKRWRSHPPKTFTDRLFRVRTQRMFLINRERRRGEDGTEEELVDIAGTTGNLYTVTISKVPSCTCPDHRQGNQCKHIIYVLVNVLKVPEHLQYQLAFVTKELEEIFAKAPIVQSSDSDGKRKPIEGDCPICMLEMGEDDNVVWCKAACGNNLHRECFQQWKKTRGAGDVTCVYCRTPWQADDATDIKTIAKNANRVDRDGYLNIGEELEIGTVRDYSTYHPYWVARELGVHGGGFGRYGRRRY